MDKTAKSSRFDIKLVIILADNEICFFLIKMFHMLHAFVSNIYHYKLFIVNGEILLKNHENVTNLYAYCAC